MTEEELLKLIAETKTDEVREIAKAIVEWVKASKIKEEPVSE